MKTSDNYTNNSFKHISNNNILEIPFDDHFEHFYSEGAFFSQKSLSDTSSMASSLSMNVKGIRFARI